jgi:hypothetical protein
VKFKTAVKTCHLLHRYQHFEGPCYLDIKCARWSDYAEYSGSRILINVTIYLPKQTVLYHRILLVKLLIKSTVSCFLRKFLKPLDSALNKRHGAPRTGPPGAEGQICLFPLPIISICSPSYLQVSCFYHCASSNLYPHI